MNNIINAKELCIWYGANKALKEISMSIPEKSITALIGPSGCGKSTFLKTLNRMNDLVPGIKIEGKVEYDGKNIFDSSVDVNELRREIGMVFQKPNPFPMSIYDNIAYGPRTHGITNKARLDEIVEKALKDAAIWDEVKDRLKKNALGLSGGQQQRLCIARALAVEPKVLLMDEPSNNLDIATLTILEDYLDRYEGIVVTVSHDRYFLDRTMKRIFAFEEGGKLKQYEGGYTDYSLKKLAEKEEQEAEQAKKAGNASKTNTQQTQKGQRTRGPQKLKFTYQEQKDYETIESDIAALEEKIEKLESEMAAVSTDFVKLNQIMADKEAAESLLEEKMDRWMYLEELAARIAEQ